MITFDHEHVPTEHLRALEADGIPVRPGPDALVHAQDKGVMRAKLLEIGAPCPRNRIVSDPADAAAFAEEVGGFPVILKTVRGGYDGKGVWVVRSEADAADPFRAGVPVLAEEKVRLRTGARRRTSSARRTARPSPTRSWSPSRSTGLATR
ncbi:N5-carboxyaminoimidazole ribonucleotide synthase [Streptomyces microflavus]